MKKPKKCIFCGDRGNISKEHFWSEWLAPYIGGDAKANVSEFHSGEGKPARTLLRKTERPGSVVTKKIRAVCKRCNNGWMSALESSVKPAVVAMLEGCKTSLTSEEASSIALWASVKTIVGEHASQGVALTPSADRYLVYAERVPPDYFEVFLGLHTNPSRAAYVRHSTTIALARTGPVPPLAEDAQRNIQVVCFLVGRLVICVTAARVDGFHLAAIRPPVNMLEIWPASAPNLDLTGVAELDSAALSVVASSLDRLVASPRVIYGGSIPGQTESVI